MKWENKGHEFENHKYVSQIQLNDGIYIFGTGQMAEDNCGPLLYFNFVRGAIDNAQEKQGEYFHNYEIISLDDFLSKRNKEIIVVATNQKNTLEIEKQLNACDLSKNKDYFEIEYFMAAVFPILLSEQCDKNYVELTQISLTERCSLKCKKCAHGCHLVDASSKDLSLEDAKISADYFFRFTDYVKYFVLIGGEPLLYRNLIDIIEYISEHYGDKIERLQISTNGTILPSKELIACCKIHKVYYLISNYTKTLPRIKNQVSNLIQVLEDNNISYGLFPEETTWMDYGFDHLDRKADEKKLISVFDACKTGCHEVRKNRFYFCVMARCISENMMNGMVGPDDYCDLQKLDQANKMDKKVFLEYTQGYSDKGYLDMCNHCYGAECVNYPIPAAEQLTRDKE